MRRTWRSPTGSPDHVRRFEPGETIVLREVLRGRIWAARPLTVVRSDEDGWLFYLPIGIRWVAPGDDHAEMVASKTTEWALRERTWSELHILSFAWPGAGHAVLHFWDADWAPRSWYVNVEAPLRPFPLGFDTLDHDLDVVMAPDRSSWAWKDEEDVAHGVELGLYTPEDATAFRSEGERGVRRLLDREPPFDREWADWRPDPSWAIPELPDGWDRL